MVARFLKSSVLKSFTLPLVTFFNDDVRDSLSWSLNNVLAPIAVAISGTNLANLPIALAALILFIAGINDTASIPKLRARFPTSPHSSPSETSAPNSASELAAPIPAEAMLAPGTNPSPALNRSAIAAPIFTLSEVLIIPPASVKSLLSNFIDWVLS